MVPITAPPGYNPDDFELSRMYLYEEASEQVRVQVKTMELILPIMVILLELSKL